MLCVLLNFGKFQACVYFWSIWALGTWISGRSHLPTGKSASWALAVVQTDSMVRASTPAFRLGVWSLTRQAEGARGTSRQCTLHWVSDELPWGTVLHMCCHCVTPLGEGAGSLCLASSEFRPVCLVGWLTRFVPARCDKPQLWVCLYTLLGILLADRRPWGWLTEVLFFSKH